jgi:GrpB-like predicted nucleotidyltransferase (UPF0157 family)
VTFRIRMVPHDPTWEDEFVRESARLRSALGATVVRIHHIGSTAVPGIYAKPVIDIVLEVRSLDDLDADPAAMESLGYESLGEFGIPHRRFYRKDDQAGVRTHHVHAFAEGDPNVERHLAFRDYLIAHPDEGVLYSEIKREAARSFPEDIKSYMAAKGPFVKDREALALAWSRARRTGV